MAETPDRTTPEPRPAPAPPERQTWPDGREVLVYESGLVKDASSGLIVSPPDNGPIRTSERGRELIKRRYALAREQAAKGLTEGLGLDLSNAGSGEEWRAATRMLAEQFAKSKNLRGMTEAFVQLGRASGYITTDDDKKHAEDLAITAAVLQFLASKTSAPEPGEAVDGEVINDARSIESEPDTGTPALEP